MSFTRRPLPNTVPAEFRNDEFRKSPSMTPERRGEKRIDVVIPVLYLHQDSNGFLDGTVLNYCSAGICLHSAFPVESLKRIFVATRRDETASFYYKTGETGFAVAVWCEMRAGAYRIGIKFCGSPVLFNREEDPRDVFSL